MDEAALVELAQSSGDADREAQKPSQLHGRAKQAVERLAARILEQQDGPVAFVDEFQGAECPCAGELFLQLVLVGEAIKAALGGMRRGGNHGKRSRPLAAIRLTPGC